MARLEVTIPENSQNIEGVVTIHAPIEKVFAAYVGERLFAQWWCRGNPRWLAAVARSARRDEPLRRATR
jgi:uncharacterized protein YndB with AHSA1/START domain